MRHRCCRHQSHENPLQLELLVPIAWRGDGRAAFKDGPPAAAVGGVFLEKRLTCANRLACSLQFPMLGMMGASMFNYRTAA